MNETGDLDVNEITIFIKPGRVQVIEHSGDGQFQSETFADRASAARGVARLLTGDATAAAFEINRAQLVCGCSRDGARLCDAHRPKRAAPHA